MHTIMCMLERIVKRMLRPLARAGNPDSRRSPTPIFDRYRLRVHMFMRIVLCMDEITSETSSTPMHPGLITLREQYLSHVRALIAEHPAQEQNRAYFERRVATSRLGRMRSNVRTKGSLSVMATGDLVLLWRPDWTLSHSATVWHPRNACDTGIQSYDVENVA
jgi:hypothetical protein